MIPEAQSVLEARVAKLEATVRALAKATADWDGGATEGSAWTSWRWRKAVTDAVASLPVSGETRE